MAEHHFETHSPVNLFVEIGKGNVHARCTETTESTVTVTGRDADQVLVQQDGDQISVVAPRRGGFLSGDSGVRVDVEMPEGSNATVRTGSADIRLEGTAGTAQLRSGSGDVLVDAARGFVRVETGSGDVRVDDADADVRVKSGSGDVTIGQVDGSVTVSTGSGDVEIGTSLLATVIKTGSGDMRVRQAQGDVTASTGSGDLVVDLLHRGQLLAKGASGDVVLGVPAGVPVWTDVTTVSGSITSSLQGAGAPREGQDHVELRARTVSGDIVLNEV